MSNYDKNIKLKIELLNNLYDTVNEAIVYMKEKQQYKENDVVKFLSALKKGKYNYVTNDNDYRDQITLLCDFFKKEYNHLLVSFVLLKQMVINNNIEVLEEIINNKDITENIIYLLEKEDYEELLELIETNKSVFLAFSKAYEKNI